jgi:hypothetical protein
VAIGVVKVGTVGTLSSGRLILVTAVDEFRATVVNLPEQLHPGPYDDSGRFLGEAETDEFFITPYASIQPIHLAMAGEVNRQFIARWAPSTAEVRAERRRVRAASPRSPSPRVTASVSSPPAPVIDGRTLEVVGTPTPPYILKYPQLQNKFGFVLEQVKLAGGGGRDAVIQACVTHPRWAERKRESAIRDAVWTLRELERAGLVRYVEVLPDQVS